MDDDLLVVRAEHVQKARDVLNTFRDGVSEFVNASGVLPAPGSIGESELTASCDPIPVRSAYAQGALLFEIADDHLTAFVKTITEPLEAWAPWSCVRALLEACALGRWLFDPTIDWTTRVGRSLTLRLEGLNQQKRFGLAAGQSTSHAEDRILTVTGQAAKLGIEAVRNRRGRLVGFGSPMPSMTRLVSDELGEEAMYRLLSAVAHGHLWAITELGLKLLPAEEAPPVEPSLRVLQKTPMLSGFLYLSRRSAHALARLLQHQVAYYGWRISGLKTLVQRFDDDFKAIVRDAAGK
jgi:hypothetical protein